MNKLFASILASASFVLIAPAALAQVERSEWDKEGGSHVFKDDLLNSGVAIPGGENIRVRPPAMRSWLIRPRTSFVPELLKSVEKM